MITDRSFSNEIFRPRVIIWQLTPFLNGEVQQDSQSLSQQESMLIIESIARISKSIVVLTGNKLLQRNDLYDIVDYGHALGLKIILELEPEELTSEVLAKYRHFGSRIFRIVLDRRIIEDPDKRYRQTEQFFNLEEAVKRLNAEGFEIHFALNITKPDQRDLAFNLDYAFRRSAKGVYCHLHFDKTLPEFVSRNENELSVDDFVSKISELKPLLPNNMYCSPQCIKYVGYHPEDFPEVDFSVGEFPHWVSQCLAGKSFAFISETGKVSVCSGLTKECGDLRSNGYDFEEIWFNSEIFQDMRDNNWTCAQTRTQFKGNGRNGNGVNHVKISFGDERS